MKRYWTIACLCCLTMMPQRESLAQAYPPKSAPNYATTQKLMDAYARTKSLPTARQIEHLYARGLAPTGSNIDHVRRWLASPSTGDRKIALVRLLGSLYRADDPAGKNNMIASDIKTMVYNGDRGTALVAVQTYARLGYQPDVLTVLDHGLAQKLINHDSYSQELALSLPFVPASAQAEIAKRLAEMNTAFGAEVLALTVTNADVAAKITPEATKILLRYIQGREPVMPMGLGNFGMNDGLRYAEWLHLTALLEQATGQRAYDVAVGARLNDERTDPRKIMGFLAAPEGAAYVRRVGQRSAIARPVQRATEYSQQFPGHPVMAPLAQQIAVTVQALRH